jgi:hydroxymethylpyrimidine/phosphomethylpyrimidine kinase
LPSFVLGVTRPNKIPTALTIAGSDSGGGAGIQADLKTFAALGVHGTSAVTCITAQNPAGILGVQPCSGQMVRRQIEAVFAALPPAAVKTGMLFSPEIVRVVTNFFADKRSTPLIVDPVLRAGSGASLLKTAALGFLQKSLLPLAALVTPNLAEAEVLAAKKIRSVDDLRAAAREIRSRYGCAALVKGGHLRGADEAVDVFFDGSTELLLGAPFVRGIRTHGTGCTYSAAITGYLAWGCALPRAVERAKRYITETIARPAVVHGHPVLNWFGNDGRAEAVAVRVDRIVG